MRRWRDNCFRAFHYHTSSSDRRGCDPFCQPSCWSIPVGQILFIVREWDIINLFLISYECRIQSWFMWIKNKISFQTRPQTSVEWIRLKWLAKTFSKSILLTTTCHHNMNYCDPPILWDEFSEFGSQIQQSRFSSTTATCCPVFYLPLKMPLAVDESPGHIFFSFFKL